MLVDLAGSERASASSGKSHLRAEEAKAINLSLSALGNCMSALAAQSSQVNIDLFICVSLFCLEMVDSRGYMQSFR